MELKELYNEENKLVNNMGSVLLAVYGRFIYYGPDVVTGYRSLKMSIKNRVYELTEKTMVGDLCRLFFWMGLRQAFIVKAAYFRVTKLMGDHQRLALKYLAEDNKRLYCAHNRRVTKYIKEADKLMPHTDKFLPKP